MKLVIVARGNAMSMAGSSLEIPAELLPMLGRPLLQRRLESVSDLGYKEWLVLLGNKSELFRTLIGNGTRWGVQVEYRPLQSSLDPLVEAAQVAAQTGITTVLDPLQPGGAGLSKLENAEAGFLGARDIQTYYASVMAALDGRIRAFVPPGYERSPGVWVSSQAHIHPSATLVPPVYIGMQADIGAGVELGPYVAVEQGAFIRSTTSVSHSIVLPMTILGEGLDIKHAILDGGSIYRLDLGAVYVSRDRGLAFSLARQTRRQPNPATFIRKLKK